VFNLINLSPVFSVGAITIFVDVVLAFVVYLNNRKSATSIIFLLFNIITIFYIISNLLGTYASNLLVKLIWARAAIFFAAFQTYFFFLLSKTFPKTKMDMGWLRFLFTGLITVIVSIITLTPLIFSDIKSVDSSGIPSPVVGPTIAVFGVLVFYFIIDGLYTLTKKYKDSNGVERTQFGYLLSGASIMFSSFLLFNFIFVVVFNITISINFTAVFVSVFVVLTSYAIIKYQLFNIKTIATELIVFALWIFILIRMLLNLTPSELTANGGLLFVTLFIGIFLIRSVKKEVQQREQIQLLANDLTKANERLKELDQVKTEFISLATHQIRAPLTAIKGYISLILEGDYGPVSKEVVGALEVMRQSAENLVVIVGDFLDVSRIEQGRMKYDFKTFDLEKLVSQVVTECEPSVEKKQLGIQYSFEQGKNYSLHADEGKIKQVIGNIIDNSIKYTPKGHIEVYVSRNENKLLVKVSDTGLGIDPKVMPKLFQKFSRATNASEANILGTGLGLYIARQLVEANSGKVWAESEGNGKGSQFYIELPASVVQ